MKELISTVGMAVGVGALIMATAAFPPILVIAVILMLVGMMADDE